MASAFIERRSTAEGVRFRVRFRLGGRETTTRFAGSFRTLKEARVRLEWIRVELAARHVPDLAMLAEAPAAPTLREVAERWAASRVDVAEEHPATAPQRRAGDAAAARRPAGRRASRPTMSPTLVASSPAKGRKRETMRKTLLALAMVLDYAGVAPNPSRDQVHGAAAARAARRRSRRRPLSTCSPFTVLPARYRLPLLVLDATGMRLGELEALRWGDVDEPRGRWRVSQAVSRRARPAGCTCRRWSSRPCSALVRARRSHARAAVFQGFGGDRFRTAITRACTAAGVPAFSPHDLRHRRISLLHLGGVPWARIGEHVGQRNLAVTANTYSHVLVDEAELDYEEILR